jgi:hypothetical protein
LGTPQTPAHNGIPAREYILGNFVPVSHLAHEWELHSSVPLTPAEERSIVREPALVVPAAIAERLGRLRVLVVPFLACNEAGDEVWLFKPEGETHSALWLEADGRTNLLLASKELDAHDTGFEFLASIGELLCSKLTTQEIERYTQLLHEELRMGVRGEIDEEAFAAKKPLAAGRSWRRSREQFERYRNVSFSSTVAEYMHGLWHDVQIRVGPEHLPFPQLRRRMNLLAEMFPPNAGYKVFAAELEKLE